MVDPSRMAVGDGLHPSTRSSKPIISARLDRSQGSLSARFRTAFGPLKATKSIQLSSSICYLTRRAKFSLGQDDRPKIKRGAGLLYKEKRRQQEGDPNIKTHTWRLELGFTNFVFLSTCILYFSDKLSER